MRIVTFIVVVLVLMLTGGWNYWIRPLSGGVMWAGSLLWFVIVLVSILWLLGVPISIIKG